MGYLIKVDHSYFEKTAVSIENYIDNIHKKNMLKAGKEIILLSLAWQGNDFNQFKAQWNGLLEEDSISKKMIKALESYNDFLRFSADQYKKAQAAAFNRANLLIR